MQKNNWTVKRIYWSHVFGAWPLVFGGYLRHFAVYPHAAFPRF